MTSLLIRDALVTDATGQPPFRADVGTDAGVITRVGQNLARPPGSDVLRADGAALAPGFTDLHTHGDFTVPVTPGMPALISQGVTTQLAGNCGFSPFPVAAGARGPAAGLRSITRYLHPHRHRPRHPVRLRAGPHDRLPARDLFDEVPRHLPLDALPGRAVRRHRGREPGRADRPVPHRHPGRPVPPGPVEAMVSLAAIAAQVPGIGLGTLLTAATFRYPAMLAI